MRRIRSSASRHTSRLVVTALLALAITESVSQSASSANMGVRCTGTRYTPDGMAVGLGHDRSAATCLLANNRLDHVQAHLTNRCVCYTRCLSARFRVCPTPTAVDAFSLIPRSRRVLP
jgi:hypothetical protein